MDYIEIVLGFKESAPWSGIMAGVWLLIFLGTWKYPAWPTWANDFTNHPHRIGWMVFSAFACGVQLTKFLSACQ